jgi:hypothetical protein
MMKRSRVRLAVSALLFLGWIGWLAYLAATTTHPVVLSRPQFLEAKLYAIATVRAGADGGKTPADRVQVREVVWGDPEVLQRGDLNRKEITVRHLSDCGPQQGWTRPGEYILALNPLGPDFQLAPIPRSPGYAESLGRIYPANPHTRRELQDLVKEFHQRRP